MHYYKRNLGDYAKKAGRLSMLQHGSYTLLIDACYDREQFPTLEEAIEWTWASTKEEIEAVEFVLRKFFVLEDGRYVQNRIKEEIAEYNEKSIINKRIANERETKRKENNTKREQGVNEAPPNHKPLTKNQEPITTNQEPQTKNQSNSKDLSLPSASTKPKNGTRLPGDWVLPKAWGEFALSEKPRWSADDVRRVAADFKDHWLANANRPTSKKSDWFAAWRIWVRKEFAGAKSGEYKTTAEKRTENTDRAVAEFLGETRTIEGEVANA